MIEPPVHERFSALCMPAAKMVHGGYTGSSDQNEAYNVAQGVLEALNKYKTYERWPLRKYSYFFNVNIICETRKIPKICADTVLQSECDSWHSERILRVSASRAHQIKTRRIFTRLSFNVLAFELMEKKKLYGRGLANAEYGKMTERIARDVYAKRSHHTIKPCGLLIHPVQNWLCASPDGLMFTSQGIRLLEIKCPSSCKDKMIVEQNGRINVTYIVRAEDGSLQLRKSHQYYTQCQVQIYCAGAYECHLFVYSTFDNHVIRVERDEAFLQLCIPKLERFFYTNYLFALTRKYGTRAQVQWISCFLFRYKLP